MTTEEKGTGIKGRNVVNCQGAESRLLLRREGGFMMQLQNIWRHLVTITEHKCLVMTHCFKVGLYKQGLLHDLSKYMPSEFWRGGISTILNIGWTFPKPAVGLPDARCRSIM